MSDINKNEKHSLKANIDININVCYILNAFIAKHICWNSLIIEKSCDTHPAALLQCPPVQSQLPVQSPSSPLAPPSPAPGTCT